MSIELRILRKRLDGGFLEDRLQWRVPRSGRFIEGMGWVEAKQNEWEDVPIVYETEKEND